MHNSSPHRSKNKIKNHKLPTEHKNSIPLSKGLEHSSTEMIHPILWWAVGFFIALGILLRFYEITLNEFYFFDEGLYLNHARVVFNTYDLTLHKTLADVMTGIYYWVIMALRTDRPLWFLLVDLRTFFGGLKAWFFIRLISALAGTMTLWITYKFTEKLLASRLIAWITVGLLAILPSHLFYSRVGLPETTSALFFILGLYIYFFQPNLKFRLFSSAILFMCAYLTNYRLIMIPILTGALEILLSLSENKKLTIRHWLWNTIIFFSCIIILGEIDNHSNAIVTFGWIFHQTDLAKAHSFSWSNLLSYPYYLFRLESLPFGILFFGNIYFFATGQFKKSIPFCLVCLQMLIFSSVAVKAPRYLSIVLPFMAMAGAVLIVSLLEQRKETLIHGLVFFFCLWMVGDFINKGIQFVKSHPNHEVIINYLKDLNQDAKIVATQPWLLNLYTDDRSSVVPYPPPGFEHLLSGMIENGYQYLVVGGQAHVTYSSDGQSFSGNLGGFLGLLSKRGKPLKVFHSRASEAVRERFVFEHSENLARSIAFLQAKPEGETRIYDIKESVRNLTELKNKTTQSSLLKSGF